LPSFQKSAYSDFVLPLAETEAEMADAIKAVQEAIETARRDGYAEGFSAAMRKVMDLASTALSDKPQASPDKTKVSVRPSSLAKGPTEAEKPFVPRIPRVIAIRLVEDAYRSISPRAAGPAEIQRIVKDSTGAVLPETSARRAVEFLEKQNKLRPIPETKTWVYEAGGTAGGGEDGEAETSRGGGIPSAKGGNGAAPLHPS
jgi:hypothetical protein